MEIRSARVTHFKSAGDTTQFTVEPDVTCLVGKNESGKTAVLEALYRLKPVPAGHVRGFQGLRDYPRRTFSRDKDQVPNESVITVTAELAEGEEQELADEFGAGALPSPMIQVERGYYGNCE